MIDQVIVLHMLRQRRRISPAVATRIFERLAKLTVRKPLPPHRQRSKMPVRSSRHTARFVVLSLVARAARHRGRPVIVGTPTHEIGVNMEVFSLTRRAVCRVTVQTPGIPKHLGDPGKGFESIRSRHGSRPLFLADREMKGRRGKDRGEVCGSESQNSSESVFAKHGFYPFDSP